MLTLQDFREFMSKQAQQDKGKKSLQVTGLDVADALKQASLEFNLPTSKLDFEVLDKGSVGFLGKGKRHALIIAYPSISLNDAKMLKLARGEMSFEDIGRSEIVPADINGEFSVRLNPEGAYLRVIPPENKGVWVTVDDVVNRLHERSVNDIDNKKVETVVKLADGNSVKVGDFIYNPVNDPSIRFIPTDDDMEGYISVSEPGPGGADVSPDDIVAVLRNNGIKYGIDNAAIEHYCNFPVSNEDVCVVKGDMPRHGTDAQVVYNFIINPEGKAQIQSDGSINFKELNRIQNVVKGQPLAKKKPPLPGKDGKTIFGQFVQARDGKDLEIGLGKNVTIQDNGNTIISAVDGHVMLTNGKITVETVLIIPGNVDNTVGNINGLGTVIIKGNVEDGFDIIAQGSIEVGGYVGKSNLKAGEDIIVKRGINGGETDDYGNIDAGRSIFAHSVQNAVIIAGEIVAISDGIVNSDISAKQRVLCKGKRAKIHGGHIRALLEINATSLGSSSGVETVLEVGHDVDANKQRESLETLLSELQYDKDQLEKNIKVLVDKQKRLRKKLSPEKKKMMNELYAKRLEYEGKIKDSQEELGKCKSYIASIKDVGKVCAEKSVYAGVKILIKDSEYVVNNPFPHGVTFLLDKGNIKCAEYEAIEEDLIKPED